MSSQIALLIDTNVDDIDLNQLSLVSNSICLTAFRLLHFLVAKFEKRGIEKSSKLSHTAVKWGYKFFNSRSYATRIEQHRLRDVKLKYFEEFENEVQRRIENKVQCLESAVKKIKPCDCLSKALTELLSDFPWERPDITSPIRGRKKKKETNRTTNLVVLFTTCPKSAQDFKLFTGKQVPDFEIFLDSVLPPALFHQFCNVSQLSLNWIDTAELYSQTQVSADLESVKIVQEALLKAKGKLFPISSVVHCGTPFFSNLASFGIVQDKIHEEQHRDGDKSAFLLPFTTTFDEFLFRQKEKTGAGKKTKYSATLKISESQCCGLSLRPLPDENRQRGTKTPSYSRINTVKDNKDPLSELDLETAASQHCIPSSLEKLFELVQSPTFQPYSVLLQREFSQPERHDVFFCSALDGSPSSTELMEKLIERLKRRNACLILLCLEIGQLAVLEPLTTHTASLWMVPTGKQLWLEKKLLSQTAVIASPEKKNAKRGSEDLVHRLVSSGHYKHCHVDTELQVGRSSSNFDATSLDRWHIPGCSQNKELSGLINKLNERINELDFLTEAEAGALRQLQKAYRQENKPPGLRDTSLLHMDDSTQINTTLDELSKSTSTQENKKTARQSVSRGEFICNLSKTKDDGKDRKLEKEAGNVGGKKEKEKPDIAAQLCDFKSPEELKDYLTSMYGKVVSGEVTGIDTSAQTMVTVVLHYMKQTQPESPEETTKILLEENVVVSGARLREKYLKKLEEADKEEKISEYQFQVLLRLEILSTLINKDQTLGEEDTNDEIVALLRTLSFISEPGLLSEFMETKILYNYVHTIPKTLANIYDELMQPLPDLLANQLSPNTSGDHSDVNTSLIGQEDTQGPPSARTRSHGSVGPPSSQPGSNRSVGMDMISTSSQKGGKKLIHHPSLADFGAKRQIVIQKIPKAKEKSSKKRRRKPSGKSEKDRISKRLFDGSRGGTKLERRQSVAVMERTHKTPKKSRSKHVLKSPRGGLMSPRRKIVAETPCHKQVSQVLRHKQNSQERQGDESEVVEESPEKQCQGASIQDTPTKAKRAKALLRRSFYSAGPVKRTRNLTQYFQLADKIAGRQRHTSGNNKQPKLPKLIRAEDPSELKSPAKNSSFLLSQLMSSPSPAKRTPRKDIFSPSSGRQTPRSVKQTPRQLAFLSPSPTKKTPRKLNATPNKSVTESPSCHTRSKSDGNFIVPSANILMSPISRRQSPRVLVTDSNTKTARSSPDKTPMKSPSVRSPVCGTISAGLDSPSHNTRIRTATTPTRKSVRAALFAKSPVIKSSNSLLERTEKSSLKTRLMSNYLSPKKLQCDMSPRKQLTIEKASILSPMKRKVLENDKKFQENSVSEGALETNEIANEKLNGDSGKSTEEKLKVENAVSLNFGLTPKSKKGPTIIQRTPSPHKKPKTKTPDSFDKWHRRKPRSSQSSPLDRKKSPNKSSGNSVISMEGTKVPSIPVTELQPDSCPRMNIRSCDQEPTNTEPLKLNMSQNKDINIRRKRSLIQSPEKSYESPSKRQRLSRLKSFKRDSFTSVSEKGSQGFDITGSFSQLSQNSTVSSVDYFSASNDEVFLSQNEQPSQEDVEMEDIENSRSVNFDLRTLSQPSKGWFSPRHKTLDRLTSGEFSPSGIIDQRSDSPVFGSSRKSRDRNKSGDASKQSSGTDNSVVNACTDRESPSTRGSPGFQKSPGNKKYSPVVSAKSLMHLIQSPLLTSPKNENKNIKDLSSPRSRKNVGDRSRRSLKLQN